MNATLATPSTTRPTPNLLGVLQGELFKLSRRWTTWLGILLAFGPVLVYLLFMMLTPSVKINLLGAHPAEYLTVQFERELALVRVFAGFLMIALTVQVLGLDYQQGTIRIILGRGVSRLQLLWAKLAAMAVVALATAAAYFIATFALSYLVFGMAAGNFGIFAGLGGDFWGTMGNYALTVLISIVATILMATAATVIGRSVAFGMGVGFLFFPADNIILLFAGLIARFTNQQFFLNITAYLLGPTLNTLPTTWLPSHFAQVVTERGTLFEHITAETIGFQPQVNYGNGHNVALIAIYCLVFLGISVYLTWKRDVME